MNPLKKLLGQTAVYGLSSILGRTLNYLLVPFYLHYFEQPSDYGVVSQLYAFVAFLMVFLTFGMETAYFRFIQNENDKKNAFSTGFLAVLIVNSVFLLSLFLFNQNIANALLMGDNPHYIVLMAAIVVVDAITALPLAKLRAQEQAKKFALIQFSSIGVNIGLNVILFAGFFQPDRPQEGVLFILIANLLSSLVKPAFLYKDFLQFKVEFHWDLFKRMMIYGFPILIGGFAGIVNETLDRILLKQILYDPAIANSGDYADHEIGVYSACYKLAMLVTILLQAYRYAAEPFFFNQMQDQDRNKTYIKLMNYFVAAMCLIFLGVSLNLDIFKYFITNKNYWDGLDVVPILLLANVFLGIYFNQSIWYKLSNQTKYGAYIALMGAALTILINVIFIPKFGYRASAWATLIVYAFQMVVSYFMGQKHYPIRYNRRKFTLYLLATLILFFIGWNVSFNSFILNFIIHNGLIALFIWLFVTIEGIQVRSLIGRLRKR